MGCGASTHNADAAVKPEAGKQAPKGDTAPSAAAKVQAPSSAPASSPPPAAKPASAAPIPSPAPPAPPPPAPEPRPEPSAPEPTSAPADAAANGPAVPPAVVETWRELAQVPDMSEVTQGSSVPNYYLVVHDNKKGDAPRLSVVSLHDGQLHAVRVKDKGRGLAAARDLECLWMVDGGVLGKARPLYCAMTSKGEAWMFKLSTRRGKFVAHAVKPFRVITPPGENARATNCEGARCFVDSGQLWLEYGSRGGTRQGQPVSPWVVRCPFDPKAVQNGTFAVDPSSLERTYWAATIDNDPLVRQCADMGQAVGMARYGQLFAAAYDDEATETYFRSYVMERLPGAAPGGTEPYKALYKVHGVKIEAIMDLTPELSIFATDDEGRGASVWLFRRHEGTAWRVNVVPPQGADPRLYGVSGLSPVDPSLVMEKSGSDSEDEDSDQEEEQQQEQQAQERGRDEEQQQQQEDDGPQDDGGFEAPEPAGAPGGSGGDDDVL